MEKRNGFTLMEILVVISIIAILAGILMPSVVAVKRMAKRAMTESLIANIGMGLETYSSDFSGFYPPDVNDSPSHMAPGEDLENSPKILCYFLESQNFSDDGRKSGQYLAIKPSNKFWKGKEGVLTQTVNGIDLQYTKDYVVDAFGSPIMYDERKSEGVEDGMNAQSFVLVSGSAFDKSNAITARHFNDDEAPGENFTGAAWDMVVMTLDTKKDMYDDEILEQDEFNDDIVNK